MNNIINRSPIVKNFLSFTTQIIYLCAELLALTVFLLAIYIWAVAYSEGITLR